MTTQAERNYADREFAQVVEKLWDLNDDALLGIECLIREPIATPSDVNYGYDCRMIRFPGRREMRRILRA